MYSLSKSYHKRQINKLNNLIEKAFNLKHKNYYFLFEWEEQHYKALQEMKR